MGNCTQCLDASKDHDKPKERVWEPKKLELAIMAANKLFTNNYLPKHKLRHTWIES